MGMEGINWDEVNAQANDIMKYFYSLKREAYATSYSFADDLADFWASGNAVSFESEFNEKVKYLETIIEKCEENIKALLTQAGAIYAERFNLSNKIYVQTVPLTGIAASMEIKGLFQETLKGVSGMNKNAADDCVNSYKSTIITRLEEFKTNITSIRISIFDSAETQIGAFSTVLDSAATEISKVLDDVVSDVEWAKTQEQDRLELAKAQTTNTFSA